MFTVPPTPEEFKELKQKKFQKEAAEHLANINYNNHSYVNRIIKSMKRGDDHTTLKVLSVNGLFYSPSDEIRRLTLLFEKIFKDFDMTVKSDLEIVGEAYEIRWSLKDK